MSTGSRFRSILPNRERSPFRVSLMRRAASLVSSMIALHFADVGRRLVEYQLRRTGIELDRSQRLLYFVGDRSHHRLKIHELVVLLALQFHVGPCQEHVQPRGLRQQDNQNDTGRDDRKYPSGIKAQTETDAGKQAAEGQFADVDKSDDHQPLIEHRSPARRPMTEIAAAEINIASQMG